MARVIRGGSSRAHVLPGEVWEARLEAERVVQRGRARAREVVEAALEEAEGIRRAAYEDGWRRARAEAAGQLLMANADRRAVLTSARHDMVRLAVAVARRILDEELLTDPTRVEALVRAAVASAPAARSLSVRVHPDCLDRARAAIAAVGPEAEVAVLASADLEPGDCVVEAAGGTVDGRIEAQLDFLERRLLGLD